MTARRSTLLAVVVFVAWPLAALHAQQPAITPGFDHLKHARLFPTCITCHQSAEDPDQAIWPDSTACTTCHDGANRPLVGWRPPEAEHPSNLKFAHELVPLMTRETAQGSQALACQDCHVAPGGPPMAVRRATPEG